MWWLIWGRDDSLFFRLLHEPEQGVCSTFGRLVVSALIHVGQKLSCMYPWVTHRSLPAACRKHSPRLCPRATPPPSFQPPSSLAGIRTITS